MLEKKQPLVSIVIPSFNSGPQLKICLPSIRSQRYKNIEIILIDNASNDQTKTLAKKYNAKIFNYFPDVPKGTFDAPYRRNFGATKANGKFIYYVDADMELTKNVVKEAVQACSRKYDAVIIHEDSIGVGVWARAKNLERRCIWGDLTQEAPRFVNADVWRKLGGLDESLGGGGDDWDMTEKLKDKGYTIGWIESIVIHHEGHLSLKKLMKKRYMYGRDSMKYVAKRPKAAFTSYFPIRACYIRNWWRFVRPIDAFFFIIMRTLEYSAASIGIIQSTLSK